MIIPLGLIDITPSSVAVRIGPVSIDWYGIGYAVALALGVLIAARQARLRRENPDHIGNGVIFIFVLGLIGARVYHLIDQWNTLYASDPIKAILPPYTGLGVYGGIAGGVVGVIIYTRRHHLSFQRWADIAVPSVFVGQAIARWGNFFNQELYGPPTNLPWGIEIDCAHRVAAYLCPGDPALVAGQVPVPADAGFQPLFFYESTLTLLGGLVALLLLTRFAARLRDGDVMAFWLIWYGLVRTALETFRLSYDFTFFGLPVAVILGLGSTAAGVVLLVAARRRPSATTTTLAAVGVDGTGPPEGVT